MATPEPRPGPQHLLSGSREPSRRPRVPSIRVASWCKKPKVNPKTQLG